jgi:hypothetical protein
MSVDSQLWFAYADENLAVAELALETDISMLAFKMHSKRWRNTSRLG